MHEITSTEDQSPFDALRKYDERGEYWSARDLMKPLGYTTWRRFPDAIERARISLGLNGQSPDDHALLLDGGVKVSGIRGPAPEDYRLTREGAYAVVQNCDVRKAEVAQAHGYFRTRTIEAEQGVMLDGVRFTDPELAQIVVVARKMQMVRDEQRRLSAVQREQAQEIQAVSGRIADVESGQQALEDGQKELAAKVSASAGEYDEFTTLAYAKLNGLPTDRVSCQKHGMRATGLMKQRGGAPRKVQDATFGAINVYPLGILHETAGG